MILFLGDSFTWGQGLQIPYWLLIGKTIDEINNTMPPKHPAELYDYNSDKYRKEHHFPNLVSKKLNKSYVTKFGNGGSNEDMIRIIENLYSHMDLNGIEFIIVQFTELFRDENSRNEYMRISNSGMNENQAVEYIVKSTISKINEKINGLGENLKWYGVSWRSEFGNSLKDNYPNNYIPLKYNNIEFSSFDSLLSKHHELIVGSKYGVEDGHLSEEGHEVISNSIVDRITQYI